MAIALAETAVETRKVEEIVFRGDLYPRLETNATRVQQYAEDLDVLPPIEVNQRNELIDGWHRWTAHKKREIEVISVVVTPTASDAELLELAISRNAAFGLQLSQADKREMAQRIYNGTPEREREAKKKRLATILSVPTRTVQVWLSRIDRDSKERRDKRIYDLWLACYTQEEIADEVGCSRTTVEEVLTENADLRFPIKPAALYQADDFEVPIYNVWKFPAKSTEDRHFGYTEPTIVDRLLYLYTTPLGIVIDPFAGSGTTVDLCKKRQRRYWVSDRKVQPELVGKVRQLDVTEALPKPLRWQDVQLAYLDPPYWKQAEGQYSEDPTDLANMDLQTFTDTLADLVSKLVDKMPDGSHIALIISPTQWKAPERKYTNHLVDLLRHPRLRKLEVEMQFQCPYESQQYNAQMVEWAKANRTVLVLSRELVVWKVRKEGK